MPPPGLVWVLCSSRVAQAPLEESTLGCTRLVQLCWTCSQHDLLEGQSLRVCDMGEGNTAPGKSELGGVLGSLPCVESRDVLMAGRHRHPPPHQSRPNI